MKNFIFTFFFIGFCCGSVSAAIKKLDINCVTEFPTTSFVGHSEAGRISVRLINSNGVQYMPISSNLITIRDLEILSRRAEVLKNIGSERQLTFDLKDCSVYSDKTFHCLGRKTTSDVKSQKLEFVSLSSSRTQTNSLGVSYGYIQLVASFKSQGEYFDVVMQYQPHECHLQYEE